MRLQVQAGFWAAMAAMVVSSCAAEQPPAAAASPQPTMVATMADTSAGNYLAGRFAEDSHDLPAAAAFLRSAHHEDPDELEVMQRSSLALAADGQIAEAAEVAKRALRYDGESPLSAVIIAEQSVKSGHWDAALERVEALPKRGFNAVLAPLLSAWIEMGRGHTDKALAALTPLLTDDQQQALYEYHAALICDLADRRAEAETHYKAALAAEGGAVLRTVQAAVAFYRRTGQPDAAEKVLSRYRPNRLDSFLIDLDSAARPVDSARTGVAEALFGLAGTLRQTQAEDLALVLARLALDLDPNFTLAKLVAADTLQEMGRLEPADALYRSIDAKDPAYWVAQLRIANDLNAEQRTEDAIKTLDAAAARYPNRPEALIALGDLLRRHSRWTDAIAAYDRALAVIGKPTRADWNLIYARGIAEEQANQWPRAEADFLLALQLEPDQPDVLNYLGYTWIERGTNIDRARQMVEKALAQRPTDGFIVDSLGWAYFRLGMYDKAVAEMERAIELAPDDATINSHLGDALAAVGRKEEAQFQWKRALIYDPDPDLKAELEKKLKDGFTPPAPIRATNDSAAQ